MSTKIYVLTTEQYKTIELNYICRLFSSILDAHFIVQDISMPLEKEVPSIVYCKGTDLSSLPEDCRIRITPDQEFWEDYFAKRKTKLRIEGVENLYVFNKDYYTPTIEFNSSGIIINLDLFSSAFFLVTRYEESVHNNEVDVHGRHLFTNSIIGEDLIDLPLINMYAKEISSWIERTYGIDIKNREKNMGVVITHDIDMPYYYLTLRAEMSKIVNSLWSKDKYKGLNDLKNYIFFLLGVGADPYDVFDYISKIQRERNVKSTWFILMENEWGLKKRKYAKQIEKLISLGYEVALHLGCNSYSNLEKVIAEKEAVKRISGVESIGVRNHFLRFNMPETYKNYEELGFLYDSTLGYVDHEGFRAGICTPFKPFDINDRCPINILELPLAVMDATLINYRKFEPSEMLRSIKSLVDKVYEVRGTIILLWHNHLLSESFPEFRNVYEESIDYLKGKNAKFYTCAELAKKWDNYWD